MTRIAVVGAGAMGSYFAASLAEAGNDVTVIDVDRSRLDLIGREGIQVSDDRGERIVRLAASTAEDAKGPIDLLIVFTKGMHTAQAIASVAHLTGDRTVVLTLQNGLGNDEILADAFGDEQVVIGMTDVPVDLVGANRVASHGTAKVVMGGHRAGATAAAERVSALLASAGFNAVPDPAIRERIWEKVAFNAAFNAVAAITGFNVGKIDSVPGRDILKAATDEASSVAEAAGIAVDRARIWQNVEHALASHVHHKPSMLQDILAGRATEIENISGAVVRQGAKVGVPTPVNATLANLVRMVEADRRASV